MGGIGVCEVGTRAGLLSVCNLFTGWKVIFDHIQEINLTASATSDFLHRKTML